MAGRFKACALPGCDEQLEQRTDGRPRKQYCCAAHRQRARHRRAVLGDPPASSAAATEAPPTGPAREPGAPQPLTELEPRILALRHTIMQSLDQARSELALAQLRLANLERALSAIDPRPAPHRSWPDSGLPSAG